MTVRSVLVVIYDPRLVKGTLSTVSTVCRDLRPLVDLGRAGEVFLAF
jgi:hypothetical protein